MDPAADDLACPECHSEEFFRSRTRSWLERLVKVVTPSLYYRCRACGWRGPRVTPEGWASWRTRLLERYAPVAMLVFLVWLVANIASELPSVLRPQKKPAKTPAVRSENRELTPPWRPAAPRSGSGTAPAWSARDSNEIW